jgi:acyl-CoA reductase-like NAD-dependent aldehyde dehydrogenase
MEESTVIAAVARAREASASWAAMHVRERAMLVRGVKTRLLSRANEIAELLVAECNKPFEEAVLAEVLPNADLVDYWADSAEEMLASEAVELDAVSYPGKQAKVHREPRGVIGLVSPWNYPVAIPLRTIIPALVTGNTVVFKPSEHAPKAGALVASLFDGVIPENVLNLVEGGPEAGAELVRADVDAVVFTGSVATGKKIGAVCAERLVPCSLELGGKDAAIVLADAPLERTARGLCWGAFTNAGQNCASIERVYVVQSIADRLIAKLVEVSAELDPARDIGAMTTDAQAAIVVRHVEQAIERGAKVVAGAVPKPDQRKIAPIILRIEDEACDLMTEETFGPVMPVVVVKDVDEAIARANASRFGLTASIWTKRVAEAHDLARRLRAGVVTINNHAFSAAVPSLPWTGVGESGAGVTNGPHALSAFVRPRMVLEDRNSAKRELWWYPYTPALRALAMALVKLRGGAGIVGRFQGLFELMVALPRRLFGDRPARLPPKGEET